MHAADIQLHSQPTYWEHSHQGIWERSQLAWSEHYTIYNAALRSKAPYLELLANIMELTMV